MQVQAMSGIHLHRAEIAVLLAIGAVFGASVLACYLAIWGWVEGFSAIERWQGLISGIITLVAAALALIPAYKQVRSATRQNLVSARATANEIVFKHQEERSKLDIARDMCNEIRNLIFGDANHMDIMLARITTTLTCADKILPIFQQAELSDTRDVEIALSRQKFLSDFSSLIQAARTFEKGLAKHLQPDVRGPIEADELTRRFQFLQIVLGQVTVSMPRFAKALEVEIKRQVAAIKDMEDQIFD